MRAPRRLFWGTVLLALLATRCADGFRQDEMDCEEALSHLRACCGDTEAAPTACTNQSFGGSSIPTVLTATESRCIMSEGCDQLRAAGVCTKAQQRLGGQASGASSQAVCP